MNGFKEFQGKDLDSAIKEACDYFNLVREKLEIEIQQDAKSGIFGIVGARKAKIRARRVQLPETIKNLLGKKEAQETPPAAPVVAETEDKAEDGAPAPESRGRKRAGKNGKNGNGGKIRPALTVKDAPVAESAEERSAPGGDAAEDELDDPVADLPQTPMAEMDTGRLEALVKNVGAEIIEGILGCRVEITANVCRDRVRVQVDCPQDSGLLIGREGQTLSAVQYLLSRIVSRQMDAAVRVQMDAGDYRQKQEDKLKELARCLADKARRSGRALSTRPLSSYHRRIVHLCLQSVPDIQTRSTGDGPLKRVVIQRLKAEK